MTDRDLQLQDHLRRWADDLAAQVPPYRHSQFRGREEPVTRRRQLWVVVAAVALAAAISATALWRASSDSGSRVATQGLTNTVLHEQVEYRIWAELACVMTAAPDTFDRATIDTWADSAGRRYRSRFTYPDGSTHDVIALDSPYYPTELYEQGTSRLGQPRCDSTPGFAVAGDGSGVYSLNPVAEIPRHPNGDPLVIGLMDTTTPVAGEFSDSAGRPAQLREERITGFYSSTGIDNRPLIQTIRVFVDPATGQINEATFTNEIQGLGRIGWIATRTFTIDEPASDQLFAHNSYTKLPGRVPPTDSRPPATTRPGTTTTTSR